MKKRPDKAGEKQVGRERTQFKKGQSGNPKGKKKGTLSITSRIKKELLKKPKGEKENWLSKYLQTILDKAIKDKDGPMIRAIWNYIDGMPKQSTEIMGRGGEPIQVNITNEIDKIYGDSDPEDDNDSEEGGSS